MNINSLIEPSPSLGSPCNASSTSRTSSSRTTGDDNAAAASMPAPSKRLASEESRPAQQRPQPRPVTQTVQDSPLSMYQVSSAQHVRSLPPISITHALEPKNKRPPPSQPHPAESAEKKIFSWTADEDASLIELRGNTMKWEDIAKHLPGRSAISCRLRSQNYLEQRSE